LLHLDAHQAGRAHSLRLVPGRNRAEREMMLHGPHNAETTAPPRMPREHGGGDKIREVWVYCFVQARIITDVAAQ
jgi:hypothetical protein